MNEKLLEGQPLSKEDCLQFVSSLDEGVPDAELGAFLALLRKKKETAQEMTYLVQALRQKAKPFSVPFPCLDIVGTGGDGAHTLNISTAASVLAAACGAVVAKHGSRASSSKCGSADLLEALGINLATTAEHSVRLLESIGICFLFAPIYNTILKPLVPIRKALGFKTTFNFMGPLLNPASPKYILLGVSDPSYIPMFVETLMASGTHRGYVFYGPGLDELACFGKSEGVFFDGKSAQEWVVDPQELGLPYHPLSAIQGGDPEENVREFKAVFQGKQGAFFDTIVLNAAFGLYVAEIESSLKDALAHAKEVLASGKGFTLIQKWIEHDKLS